MQKKGEGGRCVLDTMMILTAMKSFSPGVFTGEILVLVSDLIVAGLNRLTLLFRQRNQGE
jgi:hypothetical protein